MIPKNIILNKNESFVGKTIVLYPTEEQKKYLNRAIELHRFIYNWTLDQKESRLMDKNLEISKTSLITDKELSVKLSQLRNENDWLKIVPLHTLRNAMYDAINSYEKFFKKKARKPKYKSKKNSKQSFSPRTEDYALYFDGCYVHIEGLKDKILIKYNTNLKKSNKYKVYNARITLCRDGLYRLSYTTIKKDNFANKNSYTNKIKAIGIDLNVKNLIVTSYNNGEIYKAPNVDRLKKSIARYQRKCRKDFDKLKRTNSDSNISDKSKNALKRQIILAKKYKKIKDKYYTYISTISKRIVTRNPSAIVMENLNINSMKQKRHVAKAMGIETCFYQIRKIFEKNCNKYNIPLILAPTNYPSTKMCSICGNIKSKMGGEKIYKCKCCGAILNRDINAAINLENYAYFC